MAKLFASDDYLNRKDFHNIKDAVLHFLHYDGFLCNSLAIGHYSYVNKITLKESMDRFTLKTDSSKYDEHLINNYNQKHFPELSNIINLILKQYQTKAFYHDIANAKGFNTTLEFRVHLINKYIKD